MTYITYLRNNIKLLKFSITNSLSKMYPQAIIRLKVKVFFRINLHFHSNKLYVPLNFNSFFFMHHLTKVI